MNDKVADHRLARKRPMGETSALKNASAFLRASVSLWFKPVVKI